MKVGIAVVFIVLGLSTSYALSTGNEQSPVARVAKLMQDLSEKIDKDEETEQKLFDAFICWGETTINTKTQSNTDAQSRIDELTKYVEDLDAGKVELTDERVTLEAELKQLNADLENMENTRDKDHKDYTEATDDMKKALGAMGKALDVLKVATAGHSQGVLIQSETHQAESFDAQQAEASTLSYAADLGDKFLEHRDALFLRRILTGEVPQADWKKMNRKANFKKSYKARSFNIQKVLSKMHLTFERNLQEAEQKEAEAQTQYDSLHEAKTDQRDKTQTAFENMDGENGARAAAKEESQEEITALTTQVENDNRFIAQTEQEIATKKTEWAERMRLRAGEKEALAKAVSIIRSDDAKDLFKKSMASDDEVFLQVGQRSTSKAHKKSAAELLQSVAAQAGDKRIALLATQITASGGKFTEVITSIDEMVTVLDAEEQNDLEDKEKCEKTRRDDTRTAALDARHIDDLSDKISKLEADIESLNKEIANNNNQIAEIMSETQKAREMRQAENAEWQVNNRDDMNAADLVAQSRTVLERFYQSEGLAATALAQTKAKDAPGTAPAGQAPLPPPSTWDSPYGGKMPESNSIVAILETIEEDIRKDAQKAKAEEDEAQLNFKEFMGESMKQVFQLKRANNGMQESVADKTDDVQTLRQEQGTTKDSLDAVLKKMSDAKPGCDFVTLNYEMRLKNRHVERDGLMKAKAILNGAVFDAPDKNREIKPGDAFLAIKRQ